MTVEFAHFLAAAAAAAATSTTGNYRVCVCVGTVFRHSIKTVLKHGLKTQS